MTVIRPNSVSGITSITAQANEINFFRSNGALAGLQLNGVNFNTTTGVSTFNNLDVGGVLTYQDVTNVDSLGIGTFRTGVNVSGGQLDVGSNIKLGNAGVITATSFVGSGANLTGITQVGGSTGVDFNDNVKARFGTGNDLEIYHNGVSNILGTSNGNIELVAGSEYMAKFIPNGEVQLYNNNTRRLRVTSGGLSIQATDAGGSEHFGRIYFKQESGTVRGLFDPAAQKFSVYDNSQFTVGNDRDAVFFHDGSNTILLNNTGNLLIRNDGTSTSEEILIQPKSGENSIRAIANGAVELYHDNTLRLETRTNDVKFYDALVAIDNASLQLGNSGDIKLYHDGTNSYLDNVITGILRIRGNSSGQVEIQPKGGQYGVNVIPDAAVELYHSGTKKFETNSDAGIFYGKTTVSVNKNTTALVIDGTSSGTAFGETGGRIEFLMLNEVNQFTGNYAARISPYLDRGNNGFGLKFDVRYSAGTTYEALNLTADYEVLPGLDNTISLGNSSYRWSNIYTTDLQLSNEGKTNDVDGTWGNYTIQEGESDLFLINNRSGKKYKFNLTEVS